MPTQFNHAPWFIKSRPSRDIYIFTMGIYIIKTETISRNNNCLKIFFLKWIFANYLFSNPQSEFVSLMSIWQPRFLFLIIFFVCLFSCDFNNFIFRFSLKLTRVTPDRNIFSINVELTSTFLLYRGLVLHHHRILNQIIWVWNIKSLHHPVAEL